MGQTNARTERRTTAREARKLFEHALKQATEVQAGLMKTVNELPLRKRVGIALRIIGGRWR